VPVWPSRAGPRAGPSPLRSTSARRRRRGASPRRAARASPLRTPGPWARIRSSLRGRAAPPPGTFAPARGPPLAAPLHGPVGPGLALRFSDQPPLLCGVRVDLLGPPRRPPPARCNLRLGTGGGRVPPSRAFAMLGRRHGERRGDVSSSLSLTRWAIRSTTSGAPRRRRGLFAPARGPRLAALPSVRGLGRLQVLRYSHSLPTMCGARVVPLGPPRRLAATPVAGTGGGRVPPSRGCVRPARRRGGELRGDVSLPLASLQGDGGAVLQAHSYHPSWDKQESSNEALLRRTHCVLA
jgi:hypothetical protein